MKNKSKYGLSVRIYFCTVLTVCLGQACAERQTEKSVACPVIDLVHAERGTAPISRIFDTIEYVRLETSPECLTDVHATPYLTDKYIVLTHRKNQNALLFDRKTGKFIKRIGNQGKGPEEYYGIIPDGAFDETNQVLFFEYGNDWIGMQIETDKTFRIKKPGYTDEPGNQITAISNFVCFDSSHYAGYVNNISGNDPVLAAVFDRNGKILKTFRNYQSYRKDPYRVSLHSGLYYKNGEQNYFKEKMFNDTIYRITRDSLVPHAVFYCGDKHLPYEKKGDKKFDVRDYYRCLPVCENERYLVFTYSYKGNTYTGYTDKTDWKTFICDDGGKENGFSDDLSDTPHASAFRPRQGNSRHECYMILDAAEAETPAEGTDFQGTPPENPSNAAEDDNPVLVIATMRE